MKLSLLSVLLLCMYAGVFGNIEENFAGSGASISGDGNVTYREYGYGEYRIKVANLTLNAGFGFFPADRLEITLGPGISSVLYEDRNDYETDNSSTSGDITISASYALLLTRKESTGFVLIPGIGIDNRFQSHINHLNYTAFVVPFAKLNYFLTSRFAIYAQFQYAFCLNNYDYNDKELVVSWGTQFYFPRLMRILFRKNNLSQ